MSSKRTRALHLSPGLLAAFLLTAELPARGQAPTPCNPPGTTSPYAIEAWVDPYYTGGGGTVGSQTTPFRTITQAMSGVLAMSPGPGNQAVIHLDPGIYSRLGNGESFPIQMADWVDVQGVGAKQVVLRGDQTQTGFMPYYPLCLGGTRFAREILVDFSRVTSPDYDEMLDGVTLQGGHIQVYAEAEYGGDIDGRVSNCVFDLLDGHVMDPGAFLPNPGPDFGVLVVQKYSALAGYRDCRLKLFNNTFVQTWNPHPDDQQPLYSAVPGNVAICNVDDPTGDPNPVPPARANMSIQNNLIRSFGNPPATAMLGIDVGDTSVSTGSRTGATNAFDPLAVGGTNGFYCAAIVGTKPEPRKTASLLVLNPNPLTGGVDPAFVGEWLTSDPTFAVPLSNGRDWRLLPDSVYADEGSAPVPDASGNLVLVASNTTTYVDSHCMDTSSFDFDGEVYGNPRLSPSPIASLASTPHVDIGFDEVSFLIDCATLNDSNIHTTVPLSVLGNRFSTLLVHVLIYPHVGGGLTTDTHRVAADTIQLPPATPYAAYTIFPAALPAPMNGLPIDPTLTPPFHWLWINPVTATTVIPSSGLPSANFVSPYDGSLHSLSYASFASGGGPAHSYWAEQSRYRAGGGPNAGLKLMSNLQVMYD